jgi:hypothetical protein
MPPRHYRFLVEKGAAKDQAASDAATPLLFAADNAQCRRISHLDKLCRNLPGLLQDQVPVCGSESS